MITYKELSSLTNELGFSAHALYSASNYRHYYKTKIPKGNGEERELSVPDEFLKAIQRKIVEKILCFEDVSPYATAYVYGGSTVRNARPHIGQPVILKLDIKHFFDSVIYPVVKEKVFSEKKYSENNRILLSLLCLDEGVLPQGAPTSPIISNIIMKDFDDIIGEWCKQRKIRYTRYCDDMTFSGDFNPKETIEFVRSELRKRGYFLNNKKTTIVRDGQKKIVTGIVVNEKLNVSSEYRKDIRQTVYYCKKFGTASHLKRVNDIVDEKVFLQKLLGRINYVLSVDSENKEMIDYKKWTISEIKKVAKG